MVRSGIWLGATHSRLASVWVVSPSAHRGEALAGHAQSGGSHSQSSLSIFLSSDVISCLHAVN